MEALDDQARCWKHGKQNQIKLTMSTHMHKYYIYIKNLNLLEKSKKHKKNKHFTED